MRIIRVTNPVGVDYVKDKLVVSSSDDFTLEQRLELYREFIKDETYCLFLQVWDGEEMLAFVMCGAPQGYNSVYVYDAWADPKFKTMSELVLRVLLWAEGLGRKFLRMDSTRSPEAWNRRWGFEEVGRIFSLEVSTKLDKIENQLSQGVTNGIGKLVVECEFIDGKTKESVQEDRGHVTAESREGSGGIHGGDISVSPAVGGDSTVAAE